MRAKTPLGGGWVTARPLMNKHFGKGADKWSATARAIQLWERSSLNQEVKENAEPSVPVLSVGHERERPKGHPLISPFTMESNKTGTLEDDELSYEEIERKAIQA